jgi:hypothetical protein
VNDTESNVTRPRALVETALRATSGSDGTGHLDGHVTYFFDIPVIDGKVQTLSVWIACVDRDCEFWP